MNEFEFRSVFAYLVVALLLAIGAAHYGDGMEILSRYYLWSHLRWENPPRLVVWSFAVLLILCWLPVSLVMGAGMLVVRVLDYQERNDQGERCVEPWKEL